MLWELISYFLINFSIFFFWLSDAALTLALRISLPLLRKCQEEATSTGCTPATARWVSAALSSTCRQFVLINQQREVPRSHLLGSEPVCGKVGSWLPLFLRNTSGRAKAIEIGLTFFFLSFRGCQHISALDVHQTYILPEKEKQPQTGSGWKPEINHLQRLQLHPVKKWQIQWCGP